MFEMKRRWLLQASAGLVAPLAAPRLGRAQAKPDKLVYVGDNGPWHWVMVEEVAPAFEKQTGIKIDFTLVARRSLDRAPEGGTQRGIGGYRHRSVVGRLTKPDQFVNGTLEKLPLHPAIDVWDDDDKAGVKPLCGIKPAKVAGVVGDKHEVTFGRMTRDVPVLPAGLANSGHVLRFVPRVVGDRDQIDAQTLIDQKPHPVAIVANFRREVCVGG